MHVVVALLGVRDLAPFEQYETIAARVMHRHGLILERVIRSDDGTREVHVIRVPSDAAFAAYRADPELVAARDLRDRGVAATELITGRDASYLPPSS